MDRAGIERALRDAGGGAKVSTREPDLVSYSRDLWPRHHLAVRDGEVAKNAPAAVVWPRNVEEVASIVRRCADLGVPIAPFGAGSGVCGGTLPSRETVVVDLKAMHRVKRIDAERSVLDVEAGALGSRLEEDLGRAGYTLGHFPSSILCSTVGGWVAARSAGQCSGLYGKIEDMVVSLDCVIGRGDVVRLHRRLHGPDLTPLLIGSEGVFGIVTSAELRLWTAPPSRTFSALSFGSVEAGCEAIRDMFQAGLRPAVCRLYDAFDSWMAKRGAVSGKKRSSPSKTSRGLKNAALRFALRAPTMLNGVVDAIGDRAFGGVTLVIIFEGDAEHGKDDSARAMRIALRHGARDLGEAPARHWLSHRYAVSYRQAPVFMSGAFSDTMEVAAPWSRLVPMYHAVRKAISSRVFVMAHFSHAYPDGASIYFTFAGSAPDRPSSEALYDSTWQDALDAAIDAGGTLSHHHGVGRSKAPKLGRELGLGVDVIHSLRGVFDPAGVFNPGNLVTRSGTRRAVDLDPMPPIQSPRFDDASLLANANGKTLLGAVEEEARARGLTLAIENMDRAEPVAAFLARGAPGAPNAWSDPVDHLVAGFRANLREGGELVVRPGPRRAVGPDLYSLFHGMNEKVGTLEAAHLRVHRTGLAARPAPSGIDPNPPVTTDESAWIERVAAAARTVGG